MNALALEALHEAGNAIRLMPGIRTCTVETDRKSGEIIYDLTAEQGSGVYYVLRLEQVFGEDEYANPASPLWEKDENERE